MNLFFKRLLILLLFTTPLMAQQKIDGIAAVVGNKIILISEVENYVRNYMVQNRMDPSQNPQVVNQIRQRTLQTLIEQKLLLEKAEQDTITIDQQLLDQRVSERLDYLIQQVGSEQQLEQVFQNPMKKIRKDIRKVVNEQLLVEKVRATKFQNEQVSRREVEQFYETYKDSLPSLREKVSISHILKLVQPSQEAQLAAYEKIDSLKQLIEQGQDFAELAAQYSDDPASAKRGGDLGLISRGDFVKEYETAAFALNDGEMSDIVQTQFGFHLIQMIERRGERVRTRHILIQVAPTKDDEQRIIDELKQLRQRALEGENFSELAVEYSDDENVSTDKGYLGEFEVDNLIIPEFKSILAGMKPGEISMPFKTEFGYHIVKLEGRDTAREVSLKEDWQRVEELALNFKMERKYREWIAEMKETVPIDVKISI